MNLTKKLIAGLFAIVSTFAAAEQQIAVVDFQRVLFQSQAAQVATAELQPEISSIQQRIQEIETRMQSLQLTLQSDAEILTEQELQQKNAELNGLANERLSAIQFGQQKQTQSRNEFVAKYKEQVQEIVSGISEGKGLNMVIDLSTVVYIDGIVNITDDVLIEFDKQFQENKTVNLP